MESKEKMPLYPQRLKEILKAEGVPEREIDGTVDLLTFSLIAHL